MTVYKPYSFDVYVRIFHALAIIFLKFVFYGFFRLKVIGRENIPRGKKPFVVMPNHLSNLDPPVVSAALDIHIASMAKEELYRNWFFRWLILSLGAFSVNRKKIEKGTIKTAKEVISKGWCLGVFLEGTRSKTPGILGMPNLGPAYFANLVDVPILPVGITCSNKMFGPIAVKIGKLFNL